MHTAHVDGSTQPVAQRVLEDCASLGALWARRPPRGDGRAARPWRARPCLARPGWRGRVLGGTRMPSPSGPDHHADGRPQRAAGSGDPRRRHDGFSPYTVCVRCAARPARRPMPRRAVGWLAAGTSLRQWRTAATRHTVPGAGLPSGSTTRKVLPTPSALSMSIRPPCRCTISSTICRPNPKPLVCVLTLLAR